MKALLLTALLSFSVFANATTPEPIQESEARKGGGDPVLEQAENYEGNERDNSSGSGYYDESGSNDGGGMIGEIFTVPKQAFDHESTNVTVEDRGDVLVYTTRSFEAVSAEEMCFTTSILVISKADGSVVSTESETKCSVLP